MNLSPLKAIRKYCLFCMNNQYNEVKICTDQQCPLYVLRFGKGVKGISTLKAIRTICYSCGEGTPTDIKNCEITDCTLYHYRFGKNPNRKGIGNKLIGVCSKKHCSIGQNLPKTGILETSAKEQLVAP